VGADAPSDTGNDVGDDAGTDGGPDAIVDVGTDAGCPTGAVCDTDHNFAFVTSTTHVMGDLGGLSGADDICNARASEAGLPGTYVAWLSSTTEDASARIGSASGWLRTDRRPFALDQVELLAGTVRYPLHLDENGDRITTDSIVPTATGPNGTLTGGETCGEWTDDTPSLRPMGGNADSGSNRWTTGFLMSCNTEARLFCFGVDEDAPVTLPTVAGRRVWISEGTLAGDAGIAAADTLCESEWAMIAGTPLALMASSSASAISRLDTSGEPWVRNDGVLLWADASDAESQLPLAPVLMHLDGTTPPTALWAFTGAVDPSATATDDCEGWTSVDAGDSSRIGFSDTTSDSWFGGGPVPCDRTNVHVYCFEN